MPSQTNRHSAGNVAALIKKEIGRETNKRFLRRMPLFKTEKGLPAEFEVLLSELEDAEESGAAKRVRG